jgi:hypothetical protein
MHAIFKVVDAQGQAVSDVRIEASLQAGGASRAVSAVSDAQGRAKLALPLKAGLALIAVRAPAAKRLFVTSLEGAVKFVGGGFVLNGEGKDEAAVTVQLGPATASIAGTVTGPQGRRVAGAKVSLRRSLSVRSAERDGLAALSCRPSTLSGSPPEGYDPLIAVTDAGGCYRLELPPGLYSIQEVSVPEPSLLYLPWHGGVADESN